jgi:hypothetical protein
VKNLIYEFKDGQKEKVLEAFERLASMNSLVPDKGWQMVR